MKQVYTKVTIFLYILLLSTSMVSANDKPTVFVSILPQKYFVQQISMDAVNVEVMVQPGASPATYEPKSSQMRQLASSSAYFSVGVPFEKAWLGKIMGTNPEMQIVHTDEGITKIPMIRHKHDEHNDEEHNHKGLDIHIWLSPSLVKKQSTTIANALSQISPEKASFYQENLKTFIRKIDTLDTDLRSIFQDKKGMRFMVFHPSWGYFAKDYGLEQIAIESEGKDPKPAQLRKLIEHARKIKTNVIFVQPQFSTKSAEVMAREIKGEVIPANPLAEDWLSNMKIVANKFKNALK